MIEFDFVSMPFQLTDKVLERIDKLSALELLVRMNLQI